MKARAALVVLTAALTLPACGDDGTTSTPAGPTGATGAQGPADTTVEEFLAASSAEQRAMVEGLADANAECAGVDTSPGGELQVDVAVEAQTAAPDTPLSDLVADRC
jgi:hypothetical protein